MTYRIRPTLAYRDARAAIDFLVEAFGFSVDLVHDDDDPNVILHAEVRLGDDGVVFLHSASPGESSVADLAALAGDDGGFPAFSIHVDVDDPDPIYERAVSAGADVVRPLQDSPHGVGTRGFIVRDRDGLYWSFGTPLPPLVKGDDGRWRPASD
jgi:uncharacterized glyoxalase superfamily protein PhnB